MRLGLILILAASALGGSVAAFAVGGAPVIREPWTPLPCPANAKSTVEIEGCLEREVDRSDRVINARVAAIYARLRGPNRVVFAGSEQDWLRYRRKSCLATASAYNGGSAEPLVFLGCEQGRNVRHTEDLKATALSVARK